ncbi:hypothetical protein Bca4012_014871 [Brassica carinata]
MLDNDNNHKDLHQQTNPTLPLKQNGKDHSYLQSTKGRDQRDNSKGNHQASPAVDLTN